MRYLYILFISMSVSVTAISAQEVQAENIQKEHKEQVLDNDKAHANELIHRYICRRCGSENQMDWTFTMGEKLELIPHCSFCGKKYWPKFKPSGLIERTYSLGGSNKSISGA